MSDSSRLYPNWVACARSSFRQTMRWGDSAVRIDGYSPFPRYGVFLAVWRRMLFSLIGLGVKLCRLCAMHVMLSVVCMIQSYIVTSCEVVGLVSIYALWYSDTH